MIDRTHKLPVVRQCEILELARSTAYYTAKPTSPEDLALMRRIDELHLDYPFAGSRMLRDLLRNEGIVDWHSRRILAWRLSNTLTTDFCIEALQEAILRYGAPEIFNTDQGSQFTSTEFTGVLKEHGIRISMDGKGCCQAFAGKTPDMIYFAGLPQKNLAA